MLDPGFPRRGVPTAEFGAKTYYYRPQTKLREGYVFTGICHSVNRGGCLVREVPVGCLVETPRDVHWCGRYASYWNTFLFNKIFTENCMKMKEIEPRTAMHVSLMPRPLGSAKDFYFTLPGVLRLWTNLVASSLQFYLKAAHETIVLNFCSNKLMLSWMWDKFGQTFWSIFISQIW